MNSDRPDQLDYAPKAKRRWTVVGLLSVAFFALTIFGMIRSYWVFDEAHIDLKKFHASYDSKLGITTWLITWYDYDLGLPPFYWFSIPRSQVDMVSLTPPFYLRMGGDWYQGRVMVKPILVVSTPYWFLAILWLGLAVVGRLSTRRRSKREAKNADKHRMA